VDTARGIKRKACVFNTDTIIRSDTDTIAYEMNDLEQP